MYRRFASLAHAEKFGYAFDSQAFALDSPIDGHFRMFQTYNDGICQHSGDWAITQEYMADYLASLAVAMLADEEMGKDLYYTLARSPRTADIEFCASVVFKAADGCTSYEKKTRYYSIEEKKITSNPAKEHDKRYEKVTASETGQPDAIYRMLLPSYARGLERYQWANAIHTWACATDGQYMQLPAVFLKWTSDNDAARELRDAFEAAFNVAESYRLRISAESAIENVKRHIARRKETEAQTESAA